MRKGITWRNASTRILDTLKEDFEIVVDEKIHVYTIEDYKNLDLRIRKFKQDGDKQAMEYIIQSFDMFLKKYTNFLKYGRMYVSTYFNDDKQKEYSGIDKNIWKFVNLFIEKKEGYDRIAEFTRTCYWMVNSFRRYDYDEIYDELVIGLMNMVRKYKVLEPGDKHYKENGTFHMYVDRAFHWEAYKILTPLINDPLFLPDTTYIDATNNVYNSLGIDLKDEVAEIAFNRAINVVTRDNGLDTAIGLVLKEGVKTSPYDDDALNFNWINGSTCSELFDGLTPYERELMVLSYLKKMTDAQLGKIYGISRRTVGLHKLRTVKKIKDRYNELNRIAGDIVNVISDT